MIMTDKQSQTRAERKKVNKKISFAKKLFIVLSVAFLFVFSAGAITALALLSGTPKLDLAKLEDIQSSTIYDMNDNEVMDLSGEEYRKSVALKDIPKVLIDAVITTEDIRFYDHKGVDVKRIGGAIVANFQNGFGAEGASTVTQQVVKNSFLNSEKSIRRKAQEAYLSIQLERKYSKEQILETYLNKIYFGQGAYGVEAAAKVYFNKSLQDVTLEEAALIAGLPQRPSEYDPFKNPKQAEKRRNVVLSLMEKYDMITKEEAKQAKAIAVEDMLHKGKEELQYEPFIDQVIKDVVSAGLNEKDIFTAGLKIYTTLDRDAQDHVDRVLSTDEIIQYPNEHFRAGTALVDTGSGAIRALGGRSRSDQKDVARAFNYATQIERQPGSTIKPILDYGPAIEQLKWSTAQPIKDEPLEIDGSNIQNWDRDYRGSVTMRTALQWSYNVPAVNTFLQVGSEKSKQFAKGLGIELDEIFPSYAIGGFKHGISPLELAGAYSAFGNNGVYHEPFTVRKIVFPDGKEIEISPEGKEAMSDYTAYMITDMLKSVVNSGTGTRANIPELPMAGKTGTTNLDKSIASNGTSDAWFVGYTVQYTMAVWTGYDQTTKETYLTNEQSRLAQHIFKEIMTDVSKDKEINDFTKPDSVIEKVVGGKRELFVKGAESNQGLDLKGPKENEQPKEKEEPKEVVEEVEEEEEEQEAEEDQEVEEGYDENEPSEEQQPPAEEEKQPEQPQEQEQPKEPEQPKGTEQDNDKEQNNNGKEKDKDQNNPPSPANVPDPPADEKNKSGEQTVWFRRSGLL